MGNIELKILIGMHRNTNAIDKETSKLAQQQGLTFSQFAVLEALYSKGEMTVGEVRKTILSSMGTIPLIIDNLAKMNYVRRRGDENDRRRCIVSLTNEGRSVIEKLAVRNASMIIDYMSVLTLEEKNTLSYLMKKLGGRIDEEKSTK